MSKYKAGDKVVMEITGVSKYGECYEVAHTSMWNTIRTERVTEPLSTYTEPLETKIENLKKKLKRWVEKCTNQSAEITRLLAENKELKEDFEKSKRVNLNAGRLAGQNEAWELARKIVLKNGYSGYDLHEIFNCCGSHQALEKYTYPEAAAKVAEWERQKEEIKVGDVYKSLSGNFVVCGIDREKDMAKALWDDLSVGKIYLYEIKEQYTKTGRHIDIDSFLKQIGEE